MPHSDSKQFVLKLESFDGKDTYLHCGDGTRDVLYCIVELASDGRLAVVDNGYRSVREAITAWPAATEPGD
jgi:hypothetical protein